MTNRELLALMRDDLSKGLDVVVRECKEYCVGYARKSLIRTGDDKQRKDAANALFSEALIVLVDHVQQGRLTDLKVSVGTYLCATMKYRSFGESRKAKRAPLTIPENYAGADDEINTEREQVRQALRRLIRELGETCRQLLTFRYYDKLPYAEILKLTEGQYASVNVLRNKNSKCMQGLRNKARTEIDAAKTSSNA